MKQKNMMKIFEKTEKSWTVFQAPLFSNFPLCSFLKSPPLFYIVIRNNGSFLHTD